MWYIDQNKLDYTVIEGQMKDTCNGNVKFVRMDKEHRSTTIPAYAAREWDRLGRMGRISPAAGSGLKAFNHTALQSVKVGQPDDPPADTDQSIPFHADQLA